VTRAAATHIDPSRLLTVIVGDREKVGPALARVDLGMGAVNPSSLIPNP
jgi:hypothetical protein